MSAKVIVRFKLILVLSVLFTGCATKVKVTSLQPSQVQSISYLKKIRINMFENDGFGFTNILKNKILNRSYGGKPYFDVVSQNNESTLNGSVRYSVSENRYYKKNIEIYDKNNKVIQRKTKYIPLRDYYESYRYDRNKNKRKNMPHKEIINIEFCTKTEASIFVDVEISNDTSIVFADTFNRSKNYLNCSDYGFQRHSRNKIFNELNKDMADSIVQKLSPTYYSYNVEFIDEPDIKYTKEQEKMLKNAIDMVDDGLYKAAKNIFNQLIAETNQQSFIVFYNLGLIYEIVKEYEKAIEYYNMANSIAQYSSKQLNIALRRVTKVKHDHEQAMEQLKM